MEKSKVYTDLDKQIKGILLITEGWLVGNAVNHIINNEEVNDYDIIVPSRELFQKYVLLASSSYPLTINNYGGVKILIDNDIKIDIWCEELSHFIGSSNRLTYLYNHKRNILLENL